MFNYIIFYSSCKNNYFNFRIFSILDDVADPQQRHNHEINLYRRLSVEAVTSFPNFVTPQKTQGGGLGGATPFPPPLYHGWGISLREPPRV